MTAVALVPDKETIPPSLTLNDLDLEGAILSALLCDDPAGTAWQSVAPMLRGEHFWADANRLIFEAIEQLRREARRADPVSVVALLRKRDKLRAAGGAQYIAETLALTQPAVAHPQVFAAEIVELWRQRRLCDVMNRCAVLMRAGELTSEGARAELRELFKGFRSELAQVLR
jgi:replicative DNA helicase